ncbi:MAG: nucleotidyltransferase family protein [Thermodesulfobacteriota bacterium]|nr:nucleotidyltransferase family protein [Thermodesulfobacteriota bacterium]
MEHRDQRHDVEIQLIRNILKSFIKGDPKKIKVNEKVNWKRINNYAINQNLVSIFDYVFYQKDVPADIIANWQKLKMRILFTQVKALRAATRIFSILEEADIPSLSMRGMVLANTIYYSPDMRPMRDVDILIRPADIERSLKILKTSGLEPYRRCRTQNLYRIDDIKFEIHWSFLTAKRYRFKLDTDNLLESRKKIETSEGDLFGLSDDNEFLGLILHAFIHHDLYVILSLVDMGLFMAQDNIDFDWLAAWARDKHLTRMIHFTLAYVNYLFKLGQEERLKVFKNTFPRDINLMYKAYAANVFEMSNIFTYLRRNKNLLYIAEEPTVKFKQLLRFFTLSEFYEMQNHLRWRSAGV